jgi:hypothetical protein
MYKIVGADQKEYGPVSLEQMRQWIREGRANAQTLAQAEGSTEWKPLSSFPELAADVPLTPPPPPTTAMPPLSVPTGVAGVRTNGLAVGGMVCSIVGLFCCGPLLSTVGLILSIIGLSQIRRNPTEQKGRNLAIAGIVLAILGYIEFIAILSTGVFKEILRNMRFGG